MPISKVIEADNETRAKSDEYADECIAAGDMKEKPRSLIMECASEIDSLNVTNNWSRYGGANGRLIFYEK